MTLLLTGGAGFIGSAVVRQLVLDGETVINVDKLTYAGNLESLAEARNHPNHIFEQIDIRDRKALEHCFRRYRPDAVMHLAAESHVDRSIEGPAAFIETNIVGTYNLLETARAYFNDLDGAKRQRFRFHHISTDEVFGDLDRHDPAFSEDSAYAPSSPYSASKASSDHLVRAWHRTYGLPVLVTNCSNNYGPCQYPEKLIPLMILNGLEGKALPVYGAGENIRDWLYVEDHARGLRQVLRHGEPGQTYNMGGRNQRTNLEVVQAICSCLDELAPSHLGEHRQLIRFVTDRPGHDYRYAINDARIDRELGWRPAETFESGLRKTVRWYMDNSEWVQRAQNDAHRDWMKINYHTREVTE